MKQKIFTLFLALIASVGTIFADAVKIGKLYYNLDEENKTAEVTYEKQWDMTNYSGLTTVIIPESVKNNSITYSVTSIGEYAFYLCSGLTSISLPNSIKSIGHSAFMGCESLTSFDIPEGVNALGNGVLGGCLSLKTISIPKSVNTIIPTYHGYDSPFAGINTDTQSSLPTEGALTAFIVDPENPIYTSKDGILYDKGMTKLLQFPCAKKDAYTIPESVIYIDNYAFYMNLVLTELNLPRNVRVIDTLAFAYMVNLKTLQLPEELVKIGEGGFLGCINIEELTIGSKLKSIGSNAFTLNINKCKSITCFANQVPTLEKNYAPAIMVGKLTGTIWDGNWEEVSPSALTVYVPEASIGDYIMDENWGQFTILPITAQQTNVEDLIVVPSTNTVDCSWPAVSGAVTYELVIKDKSGNLICTLIFNAQGQLMQIAFNAPARDDAPQKAQSAGFSFTVTGLETGTAYDLTITAKNENGQEVDKKNITFHTSWPTALEDIHVDSSKTVKIIHDGQILILRGVKTYTVQGQEVK